MTLTQRLTTKADPRRYHSAPAVRVVLDFHAGTSARSAIGPRLSLFGDWSVTYYGADGKEVGGLLADQSRVIADAKACGFKASQITWTERAQAEGWRVFRAYHGSRRRAR